MQSPIANLFLSLQSYLSELLDLDGNKCFNHVDQDLGQLQQQSITGRPSVAWPCALIDIETSATKDVGQNAQVGEAKITIKIGFPPLNSTSNITPGGYRERAINFYELEQAMHEALQGWHPHLQRDFEMLAEVFGALSRTSASTENRKDSIRVRVIEYILGMTDNTTRQKQELVPATIDIATQLIMPPPVIDTGNGDTGGEPPVVPKYAYVNPHTGLMYYEYFLNPTTGEPYYDGIYIDPLVGTPFIDVYTDVRTLRPFQGLYVDQVTGIAILSGAKIDTIASIWMNPPLSPAKYVKCIDINTGNVIPPGTVIIIP